MAKKKKDKKIMVEKICTFFLKTGQSVQIKGFEESNEQYCVFMQGDGRMHKIERKAITVEIESLKEIPTHLQKLTTTKVATARLILTSGLNLNFDGWKVKGVVDQFLSIQNDLITLHEDYTYLSFGTLIEEKENPKDKKLELVENGEKRTLN